MKDSRLHASRLTRDLLDSAARWAHEDEHVVGLALVGSYARDAARADSDVDLAVLCRDVAALIDHREWCARFGRIREIAVEQYGPTTSIRVFYDAGLEVEFGIADPAWAALPLDGGTRRVISDGCRILYDPLGLFSAAQQAALGESRRAANSEPYRHE